MEAKQHFDEGINEIIFLNDKSKNDQDNYKVYNKVIILLLCAKLEKYIKDSTKEYIEIISSMKLTKDKLPNELLIELIKNELTKINSKTVDKYIFDKDCKERAKIFSLIWDTKFTLNHISKEEFAISITNNGTTAFENIYKKIGFQNIITKLENYEETTTISGITTSYTYSFDEYINKIINMRHNIIHDDATPNITINEINLYVNIFKDFVNKIDNILSLSIEKIKN